MLTDMPNLLESAERCRGRLNSSMSLIPVHLHIPVSCTCPRLRVRLESMLYYCDNAGTCRMKAVLLEQPIVVSGQDSSEQVSIKQRLDVCVGHSPC